MTNAQGNRGWAAAMGAAILMMVAAAISLPAQNTVPFTTLLSFDNSDGANPYGGLVQATDGSLYGTTYTGDSYGTVFRITPSGALTALNSFDDEDGANPNGLLQATDGNFYGTTYAGGADTYGAVFKMTPNGTLTTLHSFDLTDGYGPYAGLVQANDGNFYGTTYAGGANYSGTVFKITPSGALTTLYSFCSQSGCADGGIPETALIQATDGNFYGTTAAGGANGSGTVFKITPGGALTTLYSFCSQSGCGDGSLPWAALVQATDGDFYGTTAAGGANGNNCGHYGCGTVFKITPSGTLTTLYSFCSQSDCQDGQEPVAALIQATDGNFYGTTNFGAAFGEGDVFQITPSGSLAILHVFTGIDGAYPSASLVQDTNGKFYGTTELGGTNSSQCGNSGCGTVFELSVGLRPFVETLPSSGKAGKIIKILGTNLAGATTVTFNGTAATFTVESGTAIKTTLPTGATTGPVQVVTPSGTLTSNMNFRVER